MEGQVLDISVESLLFEGGRYGMTFGLKNKISIEFQS